MVRSPTGSGWTQIFLQGRQKWQLRPPDDGGREEGDLRAFCQRRTVFEMA